LRRWLRRVKEADERRRDKLGMRYFPQAYQSWKAEKLRELLEKQRVGIPIETIKEKKGKIKWWQKILNWIKKIIEKN